MKQQRIVVNDLMQHGYFYSLTEPEGRSFHPDFRPELTPKELLALGVFGGKYMSDCTAEFPADWFEDAKICPERHDPKLNYFGVNASQPLSVWRSNGWIYHEDPRGWFSSNTRLDRLGLEAVGLAAALLTSLIGANARSIAAHSLIQRCPLLAGFLGTTVVNDLRAKIYRFLASEDGPTAIEYAMMAALIIAVCVLAVDAVGTKLNTSFTNSSNSINAATGS